MSHYDNVKKEVVLATTFSENGYNKYGKSWIESVKKYWSPDINVHLYLDFTVPNLPSNFKILSFKRNFSTIQKNLIERVNDHYKDSKGKGLVIKDKTIKFSHKMFVVLNEIKNVSLKNFVWLDGDVETIDFVDKNFILKINDGKFLGCQTEKQTHRYPHIESGILIFDLANQHVKQFYSLLKLFYTSEFLFKLKKPYDGYVIGYILKKYKFSFYDFNKGLKIVGKTSHADETFQHPLLQEKFVHNIGDRKNL